MSRMSINFDNQEQYDNFIESIKKEVLKEIDLKPTSDGRTKIRKLLENLHEDGFGNEAFPYSPEFIQSFYGMFKITFKRRRIDSFNDSNSDGLEKFLYDLLDLINKYQSEYTKEVD